MADPTVTTDFDNLDSVVDPSQLLESDDSKNHMGSTFEGGVQTSLEHTEEVVAKAANGSLGIDVSAYNPGINFGTLAGAGRKFVIVKALEGSAYVSPAWSSWNYPAKARAAGLAVGSYHFVHTGSGAAQARALLAVKGKPAKGDLRDWIDIEGGEWTSSNSVPFVHDYIAEYRRITGVAPGVYASKSFYQNELHAGSGWRTADIPVWVAHYGIGAGNASVSGGWQIHQYAVGTAPGAGGNVDLNISASTNLAAFTVGGTTASWRQRYGVQDTAWVEGRAPVYGVLYNGSKQPYVIRAKRADGTYAHSSWDARKVDPGHAPKLWIGSGNKDFLGGLWVRYVSALFDVLPYPSRGTYSQHFGLKSSTDLYFGKGHQAAVQEYSASVGIARSDDARQRGVTTAAFWAKVNDFIQG